MQPIRSVADFLRQVLLLVSGEQDVENAIISILFVIIAIAFADGVKGSLIGGSTTGECVRAIA